MVAISSVFKKWQIYRIKINFFRNKIKFSGLVT